MNPWRSRVAFKPIGMFPFMHNIKRWDPIEWMLPSSTTKANKSTYLRWAARGSTAERRKINRRLSNIETTASRLWGVTAITFVRGGLVAEIRRHDAQYCMEQGHRSTVKDTFIMRYLKFEGIVAGTWSAKISSSRKKTSAKFKPAKINHCVINKWLLFPSCSHISYIEVKGIF